MSRAFGPQELLNCYARGVFPMGESSEDPRLFLVDPDIRGVLPLDNMHVSRSLKKAVRSDRFSIRVNTVFSTVVARCAEPGPDRSSTWINAPILNLYSDLHRMGHAHSVEAWIDNELVGGLYGVSLQAAFFGESMFSRATDASKVALVHLVARLRLGGFQLLDTQFSTRHLEQFGVEEISRSEFQDRLSAAMLAEAIFPQEQGIQGAMALQLITQTS